MKMSDEPEMQQSLIQH